MLSSETKVGVYYKVLTLTLHENKLIDFKH